MSEDLTNMYRTAITYVLLSCVTIFVVSIVILSVQRLNELSRTTSTSVGIMEQSTLINAVGLTMTGASAYRIYNTNLGAVNSFVIKMKNGRTFNSVSQLMEVDMISKRFYVNSVQLDGGMWDVVLEER